MESFINLKKYYTTNFQLSTTYYINELLFWRIFVIILKQENSYKIN